ncbi:MAG: glycerate kinase type-2 family protein [Balneolaceae bacterium]
MIEDAAAIYHETLDAVRPAAIIRSHLNFRPDSGELDISGQTYSLSTNRPLYVIGFGKASATMAEAIDDMIGDRITDGMVITSTENVQKLKHIQVLPGTHPLPDKKSLSSSYELLHFVKKIPEGALVLCLISGGASALLCMPAGGIEVEELAELNRLLIESGASIQEINTVRKLFSDVKGGRLLHHLKHTTLVDLIISDVADNDLAMIGSGPTVAQEISASDAFKVLKKYGLYGAIPHELRSHLGREMDAEVKQHRSAATADFDAHRSFLLASGRHMAERAGEVVDAKGYKPIVESTAFEGPIEKLEQMLMNAILNVPSNIRKPRAIIMYGECTVQVTGSGKGGRNQELALRMAQRLRDELPNRDVVVLSAGSDGIDGPTDAAGAVVTPKTVAEAAGIGMDADRYLQENDSYHFFSQVGMHLKPGATGNNLMDLQIVLVGA